MEGVLQRVTLANGDVLWVSEAGHAHLKAQELLVKASTKVPLEPEPQPEPQPEMQELERQPGTAGALGAFLFTASLEQFTEALCGLGCVSSSDIELVEDDDLREMGMKKMEIKRLRRHASDCVNAGTSTTQIQTLPPGWLEDMGVDGQVYYVNRFSKQRQMARPLVEAVPALPVGWSEDWASDGQVNRYLKTRTKVPPIEE